VVGLAIVLAFVWLAGP